MAFSRTATTIPSALYIEQGVRDGGAQSRAPHPMQQAVFATIYHESSLDAAGSAFNEVIRRGNGPAFLRNENPAIREATMTWIQRQFRGNDGEGVRQALLEAGFVNPQVYNMGLGSGESRSNHQGGLVVDESVSPPIVLVFAAGTNSDDWMTHVRDAPEFFGGVFGFQTRFSAYENNAELFRRSAFEADGGAVNTLNEIYADLRNRYPGVVPQVTFSGASYGADVMSRTVVDFVQDFPEQRGAVALVNFGAASSLNDREKEEIRDVVGSAYSYTLQRDFVPRGADINRIHGPVGVERTIPMSRAGMLGLATHNSYYEALALNACTAYLIERLERGDEAYVSARLEEFRSDPVAALSTIMQDMAEECSTEHRMRIAASLARDTGIDLSVLRASLSQGQTSIDPQVAALTIAQFSMQDAGANGVVDGSINNTAGFTPAQQIREI